MTTKLESPIEVSRIGESDAISINCGKTYKILMAPIKVVMGYLLVTYVLFVVGPLWSEVNNKISLNALVLSSYTALFLGFYLSTINHLSAARRNLIPEARFNAQGRFLFSVGSIYFLVWSLNQFVEFGIQSPGDLLSRLLNPGEAYAAKYDIFTMREETQRISRVTQILVLSSLVYALYIPLSVLSWTKLSKTKKNIFRFCIVLYCSSFLAIGTLKGLGDIFILFFASASIVVGRRALLSQPIRLMKLARRRNKVTIAIITILLITFTSYMILNQTKRAIQFGIQSSRMVGDINQSIITEVVGPDWAMGFLITVSYPTHGYAGLSFAMSEPFEFAGGAGIAPAFESYRYQYLGGERRDLLTYPARAEHKSGWPNGMYWSTAIALIASDISFYGVPVLFLIVGYAFSRTWFMCLYSNSYLAFAALPLYFTFCLFIPANNQVLAQRQGIIIVFSLLFLSVTRRILPRKHR